MSEPSVFSELATNWVKTKFGEGNVERQSGDISASYLIRIKGAEYRCLSARECVCMLLFLEKVAL